MGRSIAFTRGERQVLGALVVVTLVGSGVSVARHWMPEWLLGKPDFVAREKPPMPRAIVVPQKPITPAPMSATDPAPIDLNTATATTLETLPGIGPVLAERIVRYREERGGFQSIDELRNVKGIGTKRLDAIRSRLTVERDARHAATNAIE